jgi:S1-C subfamily serine protease
MRPEQSRVARVTVACVLFAALGAGLAIAQPRAESSKPSASGPSADGQKTPDAEPGVLVSAVEPESPARKAGIARGDIILSVQGAAVNTAMDLERAIAGRKPGDTLAVKLRHGDAERTVSLTLGDREGRPWAGIMIAPRGFAFGGMMPGWGRGGAPEGRMMPFGLDGAPWGMMGFGAGALVTTVAAGGPAETAGLKQGDVIVSFDGTAIDAQHPLSDLVGAKKTGDVVTLSVRSAGQAAPRDMKVTLGKNPDKDAAWLGVGYTLAMQGRMRGPEGAMTTGVLVVEVAADSPAAKAGIRLRDVITQVDGAAVADPQLVADAVARHKPGDSVAVTVYRMADDKETTISVTLGASPADAAKPWMGVSVTGFMGFEGMPFRRAPSAGGGKRGPAAGGDLPSV